MFRKAVCGASGTNWRSSLYTSTRCCEKNKVLLFFTYIFTIQLCYNCSARFCLVTILTFILLYYYRSVSPRSPSRSPGRSPARSPARRLDETDESQLERLYKPVFVLKPASFKCSEGQTARFDLKVVGRPMPETYWFHNGN